MKERLICCFYILFAKQYAVFTADKDKAGAYTSCYIKGDKIFLAAVVSYLKKSLRTTRKGESHRGRIKGGKQKCEKYRIKVTEGTVYNGIKAGIEDFLRTVRKALKEPDEPAYKDTTGSLKHSVSYTILRNGTPIDDEGTKPFRDKSIKETGAKYSACVYIDGMDKTVTI